MQWFLTLGGDDIEDGVPGIEHVDCEREKVEEGAKQKRDKHEETTNAQTHSIMDGMLKRAQCEREHICKVHEKNHV